MVPTMGNDVRSDQLAPHKIEAEEAVLGAILVNPDSLFEVTPFLATDDFFIVRHAWIWEAMMSISGRREAIDYLILCNELEQAGRLEEIGGSAYVLSLINKTPSSLNIQGYGRIVEAMAIRRRLLDAAQQVAQFAHSAQTDIQEVLSRSERAVLGVVAGQKRTTRITVAEANKRRRNQENESGRTLLTHIEELDKLTDYQIKFGRSLHILACSEHCKTTLTVELLIEWALMGYRTLYVSLENDATDISDQMNKYIAWSRRVTYDEAEKIVNGSGLEIISGGMTVKEIEDQVMLMSYGGQARGIVAIDTIQKLADSNGRNGRDTASVASASASIDRARLNTGWLWVVLCQQYVDTNERNPKMLLPARGNVMDAKAIFHDSRIMIGGYYADMWRHELGPDWDDPLCGPNEYLMRCLKNTFGNKRAMKYIKLAFVPVPAIVSPSLLKKPVQQTFVAATHPNGNGDGR